MHLALYDITLDGHHGAYLKVIAQEAIARGWRVALILPKPALLHPAFREIEQVIGRENVSATDHWIDAAEKGNLLSGVTRQAAQLRAARRALKEAGGGWDFIYASNLDYMMRAIAVTGAPSDSVPMGGMCMSATFHMKDFGIESGESGVRRKFQKIVFERVLRAKGMACVTTADPMMAKFASVQKRPEFAKVKYVPEIGMAAPGIGKQQARGMFGLGGDERVILVYGMLTRRKGFEELLRAVETQTQEARLKVLVVGEGDAEMLSSLERAKKRSAPVAMHLRFADGETEQAAFAAADAVWVAYRGHGVMSGVFYQAVCCGLPVITADYGVLPRLAAEYGVGISVNLDDAGGTGKRIAHLLGDERQCAVYRENAERMRGPHLPQNFARAVCDVITNCQSVR